MRKMNRLAAIAVLALTTVAVGRSVAASQSQDLDARVAAVKPKVVGWFRDFHQNPELGLEETRTADIIAAHLRALGIETRTGIGKTGVVGLLRGARPGPVVALRADIDALPVTEMTGLPYASKKRGVYRGEEVGLMHACGHDAHTAVLMGAAEILSAMRSEIAGTVMLIFQPAEEAALPGERSGAELMLRDLAPGLHTITLRGVDSDGQWGEASVRVFAGYREMLPLVGK